MTASRLSLVLLVFASFAAGGQQIDPLSHGQLKQLLPMIKPQPGESPWREINWITNVTEARERSLAEDKPIVIFTAADGSPLGRT